MLCCVVWTFSMYFTPYDYGWSWPRAFLLRDVNISVLLFDFMRRCGGWCGWAEPGAGLRYKQNGNLIWNGWRRFREVTLCLTIFQCLKGVFLNDVMFRFVRIWWQSSVRHRSTVILSVLNQFCVLDLMSLRFIIENDIFTVLSLQLM